MENLHTFFQFWFISAIIILPFMAILAAHGTSPTPKPLPKTTYHYPTTTKVQRQAQLLAIANTQKPHYQK